MSHCTKFQFNYTDERTIIKAFEKLKLSCSTEGLLEFDSPLHKYFGDISDVKRCIYARYGKFNLIATKIRAHEYQLYIEKHKVSSDDEIRKVQIEEEFRRAYIEAAVEQVAKKLEKNGMPTNMQIDRNTITLNFGQMLEYSLSVVFEDGHIIEDVSGVKGDFCTHLTEDLEDILSSQDCELNTQWKETYEMPVEDQNIQVLSLSF